MVKSHPNSLGYYRRTDCSSSSVNSQLSKNCQLYVNDVGIRGGYQTTNGLNNTHTYLPKYLYLPNYSLHLGRIKAILSVFIISIVSSEISRFS